MYMCIYIYIYVTFCTPRLLQLFSFTYSFELNYSVEIMAGKIIHSAAAVPSGQKS